MRSWMVLVAMAVEAALLYWVWSSFGMLTLVSLLVGGFMLGVLVMRIAGVQAFRAMTDAQQRAAAFGVTGADGSEQIVHDGRTDEAKLREAAAELGKSSLLFVAGILLAVPGIATSVVGLVMLLPPVRAAMARGMGRSMERSMRRSARITVVTADPAGMRAQEWPSPSGPAGQDPGQRVPGQQGPGHQGPGAPGGSDQSQSGGPVIQGEILPPPRDAH